MFPAGPASGQEYGVNRVLGLRLTGAASERCSGSPLRIAGQASGVGRARVSQYAPQRAMKQPVKRLASQFQPAGTGISWVPPTP